MFDSQKLQAVHVGACQVRSSCSWLGVAHVWLFWHAMPLFWQFDEQNDEIQVAGTVDVTVVTCF